MADCRRITEQLTAYVDDALAAAPRDDVDRHLQACEPCRRQAAGERGGRDVLRERAASLRTAVLPPGLRSRCEAEHAQWLAEATPGRGWGRQLLPVSLTTVLILFTAWAVFSLATDRFDTLLAAQLTADHSKCFKLFGPDGSPDADAEALEAQLLDDHGWDVHVPPSSPSDGVRLVGARRCVYADGRLPHVMYRANGADVSLYMLEGVTRPPADLITLGHRSRVWTRGATTFVLVWPADARDMANAVTYVMREAH